MGWVGICEGWGQSDVPWEWRGSGEGESRSASTAVCSRLPHPHVGQDIQQACIPGALSSSGRPCGPSASHSTFH